MSNPVGQSWIVSGVKCLCHSHIPIKLQPPHLRLSCHMLGLRWELCFLKKGPQIHSSLACSGFTTLHGHGPNYDFLYHLPWWILFPGKSVTPEGWSQETDLQTLGGVSSATTACLLAPRSLLQQHGCHGITVLSPLEVRLILQQRHRQQWLLRLTWLSRES